MIGSVYIVKVIVPHRIDGGYMQITALSPEYIAASAGIVVSVVFALVQMIFPKVKEIPPERKQGINVLSIVTVTVAIALLSCYTEVRLVPCTQLGLFELVKMSVVAMIGNAAVYQTFHKIFDRAQEAVAPARKIPPR